MFLYKATIHIQDSMCVTPTYITEVTNIICTLPEVSAGWDEIAAYTGCEVLLYLLYRAAQPSGDASADGGHPRWLAFPGAGAQDQCLRHP